jgi:hypothetical protein
MQATLVIAASDYVQYALLARFSVALRAEVRIPMMSPRYSGTMSLTIPISSRPVFQPDVARS